MALKVTLSTWDGDHENRHEIDGVDVGAGLAVHRTWSMEGTERTWDVTHTRTGLRVGNYFPTRKRALAFAEDVKALADWTRPGIELTATVGLKEKVAALIRRHRGLVWLPGDHSRRGTA